MSIMISINNNSYCLTVNEEKYSELCHNFNDYHINIPKKIIGFTDKTLYLEKMFRKQHHLCSIGHMIILYRALIQNMDYCVIFEDDAYCNEIDIHNKCNILIEEINNQNPDWDILFLGYDSIYCGIDPFETKNVPQYEDLLKNIKDKYLIAETKNTIRLNSNNVSGSHALIIRKKCYLRIINKILKYRYFMDKLYCSKDVITYISKKSLFYQRDGDFVKRPYYNIYDFDLGPIYKQKIK